MAVTLRDVADHAGVSVRTVSNVVNGFRHVSPPMREKVQAALDELGYRPNLLARSLRQGRTGVTALLVPNLAMPYFAELAHRVVTTAEALGRAVLVEETTGDVDREREALDEIAASGRVDGVLFSPLGLQGRTLAGLRSPVPVVLLGERTAPHAFDHVAIDNVAAARDAVAHLAGLGCRRIVAVGGDPVRPSPTSDQRAEGWRQACAAAGLPHGPELVVEGREFSRAAGEAAVAELESLDADGVFCFNDDLAVGVLRGLADAGRAVPDEVSVVGFDDVAAAAYTVPRLTTVDPGTDGVVAAALDLLTRRSAGEQGPPRDVVVPHRLVVRESTAGRFRPTG